MQEEFRAQPRQQIMGAGASAQFGPALDAAASRPADGSDLRDFNTAKNEAIQLRRTLAALRLQVANSQGATACFEHLHAGTGVWTRYSPEQSCLIALASSKCPDGVIQMPGLPFVVKCGINAICDRLPQPPDSGLLQVNTASGTCRMVRIALGTAPAFAQKTAHGTFQPLAPAQNSLIASAVVAAPHGGKKAVGPGFEIRWGAEATTQHYPQPPLTGLILVGPDGGSTVIRGQWGPLPVQMQQMPRMPQQGGGPMYAGGGAPQYQPEGGGHPFAGSGGPGFVGPVPGQRQGGVVPGQGGVVPGQGGAAPVGKGQQSAGGGGGLGVGGAVAAGLVGGAVGAGVVLAASNPGAVVGGANAASQWAGQNIATDAQVIGGLNDAAQWSSGAANTAGNWTTNQAAPAIGGAASVAGNWTAGAANDVSQWGTNQAAPAIGGAAQDVGQWSQNHAAPAIGGAASVAGNWTAGAANDVSQWGTNQAAPALGSAANTAAGWGSNVAGDAAHWSGGAANTAGQWGAGAAGDTGDTFAAAGQWTGGAAVDSGQAIGGFAVDAGGAMGDVGGDIGSAVGDVAGALGAVMGF